MSFTFDRDTPSKNDNLLSIMEQDLDKLSEEISQETISDNEEEVITKKVKTLKDSIKPSVQIIEDDIADDEEITFFKPDHIAPKTNHKDDSSQLKINSTIPSTIQDPLTVDNQYDFSYKVKKSRNAMENSNTHNGNRAYHEISQPNQYHQPPQYRPSYFPHTEGFPPQNKTFVNTREHQLENFHPKPVPNQFPMQQAVYGNAFQNPRPQETNIYQQNSNLFQHNTQEIPSTLTKTQTLQLHEPKQQMAQIPASGVTHEPASNKLLQEKKQPPPAQKGGVAKKSGKGAPIKPPEPLQNCPESRPNNMPLKEHNHPPPIHFEPPPQKPDPNSFRAGPPIQRVESPTHKPQPPPPSSFFKPNLQKSVGQGVSVPMYFKPAPPNLLTKKDSKTFSGQKKRVSSIRLFQQSTTEELKDLIARELDEMEEEEEEEVELTMNELVEKYSERNKDKQTVSFKVHENFDQVERPRHKDDEYPFNFDQFL